MLLTNKAIQAFDVLRAQLVVLHIASARLHVASAAGHVLELDMVRIEVLNNANIVALLIWCTILHYHASIAILLHVRRNLRAVVPTRSSGFLSTANAVKVLTSCAAWPD